MGAQGGFLEPQGGPKEPSGSFKGTLDYVKQKLVLLWSPVVSSVLQCLLLSRVMYTLLGFDDNDAGNPSHEKYFKNIIPSHYDIAYRTGIDYWGYEPG